MTLVRNERYWRTDGTGQRLPYLDGVEIRPEPNGSYATDRNRLADASGWPRDRLRDNPFAPLRWPKTFASPAMTRCGPARS
jgi:hypothetical protein